MPEGGLDGRGEDVDEDATCESESNRRFSSKRGRRFDVVLIVACWGGADASEAASCWGRLCKLSKDIGVACSRD